MSYPVLSVTVVISYVAGCACAGSAALRALGISGVARGATSGTAFVTIAFVLGQGLLSQILLLLGLAIQLTPLLIWGILAAAIVAGAGPLWAALQACREEVWQNVVQLKQETLLWRTVGAASFALLLVLAFAAAVFPPIGDAEAFYFVYGKFIAATGRITPLTGMYELFSTIGLVGEVHFAVLMILAGPVVAKLFIWVIACSACALLAAIGTFCGLGLRGKVALLVMILTSSTFVLYVTDGKVDLFAAALGLAAYYCALAIGRSANPQATARAAGMAFGLAFVAKFSYLPVLAVGLGWLLLSDGLARDREKSWAGPLQFGVGAVVAVLPHIIKNSAFFGEPFAPFVTASSEGTWINQVWFSEEATAWIVKTYPFALVFGQYPMQGGTLSYLWLAFLPLVWYLPRPQRLGASPLAMATVAGVLGLLIWVVFRPSLIAPRYILATLLLLFLPVARAIEYVTESGPGARFVSAVAGCCALLALGVCSLPYLRAPKDAALLLAGRLPLCRGASVYCQELEAINELAAPGERVFYSGYYTYWLRADLLLCRNTAREIANVTGTAGAGEAWTRLFDGGFGLLVVDRTSHGRDAEHFIAAPPPWLAVTQVFRSDRLTAHRLESRDPAHRPGARCVPHSGRGWQVVYNGDR